MSISLTRSDVRLRNDVARVITKPYLPAGDGSDANRRTERLISRIMALSPEETAQTLGETRRSFGQRHADLDELFMSGFRAAAHLVPDVTTVPDETRRLIGSYFMHEYSLEAAALTNPSIVPDLDQSGLPDGSLRIIVSLRAIGEGHVSSIEFRSGVLDHNGNIDIALPATPITGHRESPIFDKAMFTMKLSEMHAVNDLVGRVLIQLEDRFTMVDLDAALTDLGRHAGSSAAVHHVIQVIHWLASSNYELTFPPQSELSERVLFPNGPTESRGMEDARLVQFVETDGSVVYYATYTAYDGFHILPQLIETADFQNFRITTLNGPAAVDKGIAIFPRRIGGRYAALARCDGESNYLMMSDHIRFWHDAKQIQIPAHPWELMQIGNGGAPMETDAGWLVVTHGVGPMRQYALGAILLDLEDPSRVIGRLREPLLTPNDDERDGYVPNVVYSCGSLIHGGRVVIAYGASDMSTTFATVQVEALLAELT